MELFAAATGCSDSKIARDYLERAGNDVTRAVNHYLDAPPTRPTRLEDTVSTAVGGPERSSSSPRALKRPRLSEQSTRRVNSGKQELLDFEQPARRSAADGGGSCSRGAESHLSAVRADTMVCANPIHSGRATAAITPSAEWYDVVQRCQSEGVMFEDKCFMPRPSSLDGRPGGDKQAGNGKEHTDEQRYRRTPCDSEERVRCECAVPAKVVTVNKAGVNQGRLFYGCIARKCNFFRWADDAPHTRQALSLVWRRFSPPRFKLCAVSGVGGNGGSCFKLQDIRQGAVGDCWFLAGLAVVSERSDLIGRVLGSNSPVSDEVGCYEVNLFKDGRWERVLVDSWLPCKDPARLKGKEKGLDHVPAFAKASNNEIWPCIVEKAFAKQHGSYGAISGGHICEAFEALTGAPTETIVLDHEDSEANWAKLLSFSHSGFPMGCATSWDPLRDLRDVGLVSTHAYSVLEVRELPTGIRGARQPSIRDWAGLGSATAAAEKARRRDGDETHGQPLRLVRVRNPWGKKEWTGEWSDRSERWSDSVRAELGWSKRNDGTFWMTWQDFMSRFEVVDVCKARKGWAHTSVAKQVLPPSEVSRRGDTARSFRLQHQPVAVAKAEQSGQESSPKIWAYITVVQPTKRGRRDRYWYRALGLLVTESGNTSSCNNDQKCGGTTLVAARLGGAKRRISCEVFLESGKAYTASVVCLSGRDGSVRSGYGAPHLASPAVFSGFVLTVYSARRVQVVAGEQRPTALGYFHVGPPLHQAISHLWLTALESGSAYGSEKGSRAQLRSYALSEGAALAVVSNESAAVFVLINASSAEIGLRLTLMFVEGATVSASASMSESSDSGSVCWCPPGSQRIVLALARKAEYGTFRHEFFYRQLVKPPPSVSKPLRVEESKPERGYLSLARRHPPTADSSDASKECTDVSGGGRNSPPRDHRQPEIVDLSCSSSQDKGKIEAVGEDKSLFAGAESGASFSLGAVTKSPPSGVFSPQPLLPGAREIVRRAQDALLLVASDDVSVGGPVEGMDGGTVGNYGEDLGSAS